MAYEFKVTLNKIFTNTPSFSLSDEEKNALKTYSKDTYYTIINRLSRNTSLLSRSLHRLGTYVDIRSTSKKEGKVASAQYIPFYIYTSDTKIAEETLPVLIALFQKTSIKFPIRISLYRSIDNAYKKYFINNNKNYEDRAFTSTSISLDFVLGFKKETGFKTKLYLLPEIEYSLIPLRADLSEHEHEEEVLLNTGCVYFYIGQSNYEITLKDVKETAPIYEYILLPNMETYNQIGEDKLHLIGKGIHEDYMDILESIKYIDENDKNKSQYIAELEYLLQHVTRPQPNDTELLPLSKQEIKDRYRYFVDNIKQLQQTLFNRELPDSIFIEDNIVRKINKQRRDIYILREYNVANKTIELHNTLNKVVEHFNKLITGGAASNRFQFYKNYLRSSQS